MFEPSPYEAEIIAEGIFEGEEALKARWLLKVKEVLGQTSLRLPELALVNPVYGGRVGQHTEYLQPLLNEMTEVVLLDPAAEW
jgi:ring-1,2-phenylacetyl-CoA epoxidase subunit PaaC